MTDRYSLDVSPPPLPFWKRFVSEKALSGVALLVAASAAMFSGLQYRVANRQADIAESARRDAKTASDTQAKDVERSRVAAEISGKAANTLAEAMARSASAAETSARAGLSALDLNRRAALVANAPQFAVIYAKLQSPLDANVQPIILTDIANIGHGTAFSTEASFEVRLGTEMTFEFPQRESPSILDIPATQGTLGIHPSLAFPRALTSAEMGAIRKGALYLYVYGRVRYLDRTFEPPRPYTMNWCRYYDPDSRGADKEQFIVCPINNFVEEK